MKPLRLLLLATALAWLAGFIVFLSWVPLHATDPVIPQGDRPDALVVLTGPESARLTRGADLFKAGLAPRMLISGVAPMLNEAGVLRKAHRAGLKLPGGVTLGYRATDTVGNAMETASWACANHIHHIWLITADYHMPRALWLLRTAMPDIRITPDAVIWGHGHSKPLAYYAARGVFRRLVEYHKDMIQHVMNWLDMLPMRPATCDATHDG